MSGEPPAQVPRPRRKPIFEPEPWQEAAGRTWSHWDLWFCLILVSEFDEDWAAFSEEVWRRRSPYLLTLDEESKSAISTIFGRALSMSGWSPPTWSVRRLVTGSCWPRPAARSWTSRWTVAAT